MAAEKRSDSVISFKVPEHANERLEEISKLLSGSDVLWRRPMSRHQAARAIVLAVLGVPGYESVLQQLNLRKEEDE